MKFKRNLIVPKKEEKKIHHKVDRTHDLDQDLRTQQLTRNKK